MEVFSSDVTILAHRGIPEALESRGSVVCFDSRCLGIVQILRAWSTRAEEKGLVGRVQILVL